MQQPISAAGIQAVTPYQIYARVANDFTRNLFIFGAATLFVWWLAGVWRLGAQGLFWMGAAVVALEVLQVLAAVASSLAAPIMARQQGQRIDGEKWMLAATVVRVADAGVSVGLLYFLYGKIW